MSDVVITVDSLGKRYVIGKEEKPAQTLVIRAKQLATTPFTWLAEQIKGPSPDQVLWALKDVSFEVKSGEVVGIIGRNGAGKSTLLKILSRITEPTEGYAELHGRVGSLLEVGTGMHPELTGRENIYMNATLLGMTKREVDSKLDEIVDFSGVEKFIDTPVKRYSSGMNVRLGFSIAAHLEPELLIVDEVLAVGDADFQNKCLGKMGDVARKGRTVLMVSHNMRSITDLCGRCIWLEAGKIAEQGSPQQTVIAYRDSDREAGRDGIITPEMHSTLTGHIRFHRIALSNDNSEVKTTFFFGELLRVEFEFEVLRPIKGARLMVGIRSFDGTLIAAFHNSDSSNEKPIDAAPGMYIASLEVKLELIPGAYNIDLGAKPIPGYWGYGSAWAWAIRTIDFCIDEVTKEGCAVLPSAGLVRPLAKWDIRGV